MAPRPPIAASMRVSTSPHTRLLQKSYWSGPSIDATGTLPVASAGASVESSDKPWSGFVIVPTLSRYRPSQPVRRFAFVAPTSQ